MPLDVFTRNYKQTKSYLYANETIETVHELSITPSDWSPEAPVSRFYRIGLISLTSRRYSVGRTSLVSLSLASLGSLVSLVSRGAGKLTCTASLFAAIAWLLILAKTSLRSVPIPTPAESTHLAYCTLCTTTSSLLRSLLAISSAGGCRSSSSDQVRRT